MARRISLPTLEDGPSRVDVIRRKLGGRAESEPGAGELVGFLTSEGVRHGVVLFVEGDALEVWTEPGVVHRVRRDQLATARPASASLSRVAAEVGGFASLVEGQHVFVTTVRGRETGRLVEKCRFGGLVERADGTLVGVGFRRLIAASDGPPN